MINVKYPLLSTINKTDTFDGWRQKNNVQKDHSEYIELIFGDWDVLRTSVKDNMVGSINETYEYAYQNDLNIQKLTERQDNAFINVGLSEDGDYTSGQRFYGTANNIKLDIDLIDFRLNSVDVFLHDLNGRYVSTVDHIEVMRDNIGLDVGGVYTSDHWGSNTYAISDNIGNDIHDLDYNLKLLNTRHDKEFKFLETYIIKVENYSFDLNDRHINTLNHIGVMRDNIGLDDDGIYISNSSNVYAISDNIGNDINYLDKDLKSLNDRHDGEITLLQNNINRVETYAFDLNDRHINSLNHIGVMRDNIGLSDTGVYTSDHWGSNTYAISDNIGNDIHDLDYNLKLLNTRHDKELDIARTRRNVIETYAFDLNDRYVGTLNHIDVIRDNIGLSDVGVYTSYNNNVYATGNVISSDINLLDMKLKSFKDEYEITVDGVYESKFIDLFSTRQDDRDFTAAIEDRITKTQISLGISEDGGYTSHPLNESAKTNNVRSDITALDDRLQFLKDDIDTLIQTHTHIVSWSNLTDKPNIDNMIDTAIRDNTFESGTTMVFYQSSPPNGWHLVTTDTDINGNKTSVNDTLLRVMQNNESGGTIRGDTYASNVFNHDHPHTLKVNGTTDGHTLSINEMPSHEHSDSNSFNATGGTAVVYNYAHGGWWYHHWRNYYYMQQVATGTSTNSAGAYQGGGGSHYHSLSNVGLTGSISNSSISPKYSNMILCRRD